MNRTALKMGLRQLQNQGWEVAILADEYVEFLFDGEGERPSRECEERFLTSFKARIQGAAMKESHRNVKRGRNEDGR